MADDGFISDRCTVRHLSCRERAELKERVIARADKERQRLLRRWAASIVQAFRPVWRRANELHLAAMRRLIVRLERQAALRQLAAMDDRELRDIGISRLEIEAAARSNDWTRGDRSPSGIQAAPGEKHAKGLLDRPRLCS